MKISKILIVDDSEEDHFLCEYVIKKYDPNIEIFKAFDGKEAIDLLQSETCDPEIIFLDINMPLMNGHEFLAHFDTANASENMIDGKIVIMLSSSDQRNDQNQSQSYEAVKGYFVKPLENSNLEQIANDF